MEGDRERFAHVAKHLYRPRERWGQVIDGLGDALARALANGCVKALLRGRYPGCKRVSPPCREHVLSDHDHRYAPAYREAIANADTAGRFRELPDGRRGWAFVGDRGVYVVVREVGAARTPRVKTAYRAIPRRPKDPSPEDFFKEAVRKLNDKTSWTEGGE
jgi:hypothetical protein